MNTETLLLLASYPLGDDTPIWLYVLVGILALGLVAASIIMSKMSKGQQKNSKEKKK